MIKLDSLEAIKSLIEGKSPEDAEKILDAIRTMTGFIQDQEPMVQYALYKYILLVTNRAQEIAAEILNTQNN